ncbi:polysaccharide deacetylase family protein [Acidobacteria bacterium AH-259-A15]|nr:polysaccharide deacetylase family protein [Acidobacteria bacterium AH-259-A15]
MQRLSQEHVFISYSEAVDRIRNGTIDRPYLSLSFDDGFKSGLRAAEIMKQLGIKGCFFLCSSMIGETDHERIEEFCAKRLLVSPNEFLSWDEVEQLLEQGNEIGCHTANHPNMARLSIDELTSEIFQSRELLGRKVGAVKHFSWPFGRFSDFSAIAAKIVFEAGFESCASGVRGCHVVRSEGKLDLCIMKRPYDRQLASGSRFVSNGEKQSKGLSK